MKVKCIAGLYDPKTSKVFVQDSTYDLPADFVALLPGYFARMEETMQKAPENKMVTAEKETTKTETPKKKAVKKSG